MTPYFQSEGVTLYCGDCREILPGLPRGLTVTDPPYNVGYHYDEHGDNLPEEEYWDLLSHALKVPFVMIHYPEAMFQVSRMLGRDPDKIVAWVYNANTPRQWRSISWWGITPDFTLDGQPYLNESDKRIQKLLDMKRQARLYDWWKMSQVKNVSEEKTEHPCQIPIDLMTRILKITPYDGPVIDPFAGSGATLHAARRMGREAIGIEISQRYCDIAVKKLNQAMLPF